MPVICVTEIEYRKAEAVFESCDFAECIPVSADESALAKTIAEKQAFGAVLGVDRYVGPLYRTLPRGGIIARFGVGHDGVDKAKATAAGVIVTNTPGVLDQSVAEHAVFLMGALARRIAAFDAEARQGTWQGGLGIELAGRTLLILGCGKIGCRMAKIASAGLGMRVIGYDAADLDVEQLKRRWGFALLCGSLPEALAEADVISIHLPATDATRHLVNREFLQQLKGGCLLVNTARGSIVDESALYEALVSGRVAGAALDVFENEPYEPTEAAKDLRRLSRVIMTPHVASATIQACDRMARRALANVKACLDKRYDELDLLNPDVLNNL